MDWLSRTLCPLQAVHGQSAWGPSIPCPVSFKPVPSACRGLSQGFLCRRRWLLASLCPHGGTPGWLFVGEDGQSLTMWTGVFMCKASQCAAWSQGGAPPEPQGT